MNAYQHILYLNTKKKTIKKICVSIFFIHHVGKRDQWTRQGMAENSWRCNSCKRYHVIVIWRMIKLVIPNTPFLEWLTDWPRKPVWYFLNDIFWFINTYSPWRYTLNRKGHESEVKKAKKVRLRTGRVRTTFAFVENLFMCRDAGAPHVRLWIYLVACLLRQYDTEGESAEVKWKEQKGLTIATKELKEIKVRERERGG